MQLPNWMKEANRIWTWIVNGDQPVEDTIKSLSVELESLWHDGFSQGFKTAQKE